MEIWELVIDQLGWHYAISIQRWQPFLERMNEYQPPRILRTLRRCTLVCRRWRWRAQMWAFRFVRIHSVGSLHRLANLLAEVPALASCIHFVQLSCSHVNRENGQSTFPAQNVAARFPIVLRSKLLKLHSIVLAGYNHTSTGKGNLPHLLVPPRLSAPCSAIVNLTVYAIKFANFSDFAKLLSCFSHLEELRCDRVSWSVLGVLPGCMTRKNSYSGRQFLGRLCELHVSPLCKK